MIYTSENNWYNWQYGDQKPFGRQTGNLEFKTTYGKFSGKFYDFKTELDQTAASTLDHYPGLRPQIFFSGGVDSELILRSYINIGANPEVYIARYENDMNIHDISYAIIVCNLLGVKYNIIDFNIQKFYENDAETISDQAQIDEPSMLPQLKFTESADGLIIVGMGDLFWTRVSDDYSQKSTWISRDFEFDNSLDKYSILHNRTAIYQWWKWSPGITLAYTKLKWFNQLINDELQGKLGVMSTKLSGFQEIYPDLMPRKKYVGFEKNKELLTEFENFIKRKNNGLIYRNEVHRTLEELLLEITGKPKI